MPPEYPYLCATCGRPVDHAGICPYCSSEQASVQLIRKPQGRARGEAQAGRGRRRERTGRWAKTFTFGLLVGLLLPRPWDLLPHPSTPPTPLAASAPLTPAPTATPTRPPTPAPTPTPTPRPRIVSADALSQQPWKPVPSRSPARVNAPAPARSGAPAPARPSERPAPRAPGANEPGSTRYTIKAGDTLGGIALRFYGDANQTARLRAANPSINPRVLPLGQAIVIPRAPRPTPQLSPGPRVSVPARPRAQPAGARPHLPVRPASSSAAPRPQSPAQASAAAESPNRYRAGHQDASPVSPREPRDPPR